MSTTKTMKPGTWCKPSGEGEWRAILDLAEGLGLGAHQPSWLYDQHRCIWVSDGFPPMVSGLHDSYHDSFVKEKVSVPEFIAGMYAEAERRKSDDILSAVPKRNYAKEHMDAIMPSQGAGLFKWVGDRWVDVSRELLPQLKAYEERIKALETAALAETIRKENMDLHRRLEELERNPFVNTAHRVGNSVVIEAGVAEVINAAIDNKRLLAVEKALDEHLQQERGSGKYSDPMLYRIPPHFRVEQRGEGREMTMCAFDPKASPTGIPFEVALAYLKAGREVRRKHWLPPTLRVEPRGVGGAGGMCMVYGASLVQSDFLPSLADLLATDWEVIPETAA